MEKYSSTQQTTMSVTIGKIEKYKYVHYFVNNILNNNKKCIGNTPFNNTK